MHKQQVAFGTPNYTDTHTNHDSTLLRNNGNHKPQFVLQYPIRRLILPDENDLEIVEQGKGVTRRLYPILLTRKCVQQKLFDEDEDEEEVPSQKRTHRKPEAML